MSEEREPSSKNHLLYFIDTHKEKIGQSCETYVAVLNVINNTIPTLDPTGEKRSLARLYAHSVHNNPQIAHQSFCPFTDEKPLFVEKEEFPLPPHKQYRKRKIATRARKIRPV